VASARSRPAIPSSRVRNALAREKQHKCWHREKKALLIERANPTCRDRTADFPHQPASPPKSASLRNSVIPTGASALFADAQWRDLSSLFPRALSHRREVEQTLSPLPLSSRH